MGRKRLPPENKRHDIHITLPKHLIDKLKEKNVNISQLVEKSVSTYLELETVIVEIKKRENVSISTLFGELLKDYLKNQ